MKVTKDCRRGRFTFLDNDVYIGRSLDFYGECAELEVGFLCSLLREGNTVIDVGANIGTHAIPMARAVGPTGGVVAFEPQPEIASLLEQNVRQNEIDNIGVIVGALASAGGEMYLPPIDYSAPGNFGSVVLEPGEGTKVGTLDALRLPHCRLIKIDAEGMEAEVLEGARETIARLKPLLYVENDRFPKSAALIELIRSLGYEMYWHAPWLFNPRNFAGHEENLFPGEAGLNMLCVPEGVECKQAKQLRRVTGPYDHVATGRDRPANLRPANGWAAVVRFGGIGDNLMAASAVGALKRKGLRVEVITSSDCAWQVFQHNPNIDKLSIKTKSEMAPHGLEWQKWFRGRADEYDVFAHLSHSCEGLLAFFPASTQFHWPAHVRREIANKNYLEIVHDIAGCGYDFGPLFYSSEAERAQALETKAKVGERCIAWVLSGTRIDKVHPHSPGIIARIIKEVGAPIVMLGKPGKNFEDAKAIMEHVERTNGSLDGLHSAISSASDEKGHSEIEWPIRRGIAFAQVCDLVIGPDTGFMWGVAFAPMPKVMLLSHTSPENITKHWTDTTTLHADVEKVPCWPCHQLHDSPEFCTPNKENNGAACMTDISVDRVVRTVAEIWGRA